LRRLKSAATIQHAIACLTNPYPSTSPSGRVYLGNSPSHSRTNLKTAHLGTSKTTFSTAAKAGHSNSGIFSIRSELFRQLRFFRLFLFLFWFFGFYTRCGFFRLCLFLFCLFRYYPCRRGGYFSLFCFLLFLFGSLFQLHG